MAGILDIIGLLSEAEKDCLACKYCGIGIGKKDGMDRHVFGNGCAKNPIMIVGQNPGYDEIKARRGFIGRAGKELDRLLEHAGIKRDDCYITNAVKCYTDENATPTDEYISNCKRILEREIEILHPRLIITLGKPAMQSLTGFRTYKGVLGSFISYNGCQIAVCYHPSVVFHSTEMKADLYKQFEDIGYYLKAQEGYDG